jgi:hypothetical protein
MSAKTFGAVIAFAGAANAFWRMPCSGRLSLERADPVVSPGMVSGHVHTISGGNGFGFSMDYKQANASTCSSCPIKKDLSNYWTPKLYYMAEDGTFEDVPQAGEGNGRTGGMTVYSVVGRRTIPYERSQTTSACSLAILSSAMKQGHKLLQARLSALSASTTVVPLHRLTPSLTAIALMVFVLKYISPHAGTA